MTRNKKLVKMMALAVAASTVATSVPAYAAFDATYYAQQNPDVVAAIGTKPADLEMHYNVFGKKEGRAGSADEIGSSALRQLFDAEYYAKLNPDVAAVYGNDANALFSHFLQFGIKEGRKINPYFDVNAYKKAYPDLVAAFGDDIAAYYNHFATNGIKEHRTLGGFPAEKIVPGGVAVASSGGSSSSSGGGGGSSSKPAPKPAEEQVTPAPDPAPAPQPDPTPDPTPAPAPETAKTAEAAVKSATKALADAKEANKEAQDALAAIDIDSLGTTNKSVASTVAAVAGAKGTNAATQKYVDATQKLVDTAASAISDAKANPTSDNKTAAEKAAKEAVTSAQSTLVRAQANTEKAIDAADSATDALKAAQVAATAAKNAKEAAVAEKTATQDVIDKLDNLIAISDKNLADAQATIAEADQAYTKATKDRAAALKVANAAVAEAEKLYKYQADGITEDVTSKTVDELTSAVGDLKAGIQDVTNSAAKDLGLTNVTDGEYVDKDDLSTDKKLSDAEKLYQKYLDALADKHLKAVKTTADDLNKLAPGAVVDGEIDNSAIARAKKDAAETASSAATTAIAAWNKAVKAYNDAWKCTTTGEGEGVTYAWTWNSSDDEEYLEYELSEAFKGLQKAGVVIADETALTSMKAEGYGTSTATGPKYNSSAADAALNASAKLKTAEAVGGTASGAIDTATNAYKDAYVDAYGGTKTDGTTTVAKGSTELASDFKALSDDVVTKTTARDNAKKATDEAIKNKATVTAEEDEKVAEAADALADAKFDRKLLVQERYNSADGSTGVYDANIEKASNDKLALEKGAQETALEALNNKIKANDKAIETTTQAVEDATTNKANADAALADAQAMEDTAEQQLDTANGQVREVNGIKVTE